MDTTQIEARIAKLQAEITEIIGNANKAIGHREGQISVLREMAGQPVESPNGTASEPQETPATK